MQICTSLPFAPETPLPPSLQSPTEGLMTPQLCCICNAYIPLVALSVARAASVGCRRHQTVGPLGGWSELGAVTFTLDWPWLREAGCRISTERGVTLDGD